MADRVRVIGVGNPDRGDDGVGPAVAGAVAERAGGVLDVMVATAEPWRLIECWDGAGTAVVVDAVVDGQDSGTVTLFTGDEVPDDRAALSSHGMGVGSAIALARALNRMPARLVVVGVSATDFEGHGLTPAVGAAVSRATDTVMEVVQHA